MNVKNNDSSLTSVTFYQSPFYTIIDYIQTFQPLPCIF